MRILIGASSALDRGSGIAAATRGLCSGLRELGHDIVLASPAFNRPQWAIEHGMRHVLTDPNEPQADAAKRIIAALAQHSVDAVVNNDNSAVQSLAPILPVPFVSIMHLPTHAIGALAGYNAQYVDYLVAISPDMQAAAVKRFGLPIHRVPLIYNGVVDHPAVSAAPAVSSPPIRAVFAGGGNQRKGADLMLQFVRSARFDPATLVLDWFDVLPEAMAREIGKVPYVRLHGRVPAGEFLERLSQAHLVLLPSRVEGCPMALLEAMCRSVVPVVSDGVGAMKWIVQSGYNGYTCSLRDWQRELLGIIEHTAAHREVLQQLAQRARQTFLARFTDRHVATFICELLRAPTIDRTRAVSSTRVLKWTRPAPADGSMPNLWERLCWRTGLLRTESWLHVRDAAMPLRTGP